MSNTAKNQDYQRNTPNENAQDKIKQKGNFQPQQDQKQDQKRAPMSQDEDKKSRDRSPDSERTY